MIVPPEAGVASALGMLAAPPRVDRVATFGKRLDGCTAADLERAFAELERDARQVLAGGGWADDAAGSAERLVDARCVGQGAHMPVPLPAGPWPTSDDAVRALVAEAFHAAYLERYRRPPPKVPIDLVHTRIVMRGPRFADQVATGAAARTGGSAAAPGHRRARFAGGETEVDVYDRAALPVGFSADGPALVEEAGSTLVVGPGGRFSILPSGNILVEVGA
jgi:N-methylhydantoinase A